MRRLQQQASHDEGKGTEAAEAQQQEQEQEHQGQQGHDEEDGENAGGPRGLAVAPAPSSSSSSYTTQPGDEEHEEGEEEEPAVATSVVLDPAPLPCPSLAAGRRCLLPVRLAPGAPIQPQPALHSVATGKRYLFLRCLVREKARVMIMLAAVLHPVPTGSVQAVFPEPDPAAACDDDNAAAAAAAAAAAEEAAEVAREQAIVWCPSGEKVVVKVTDRRVLAQELALNAAALTASSCPSPPGAAAGSSSATTAAAADSLWTSFSPPAGGLLLENPFDEISALALLQQGPGEEEEGGSYVREGKQHFVPILDALMDDGHVYMVMPFFSGKDLFKKVEAYGRGVCEERAAAIVRQAALGLLYMKRSHRIAHRDVSLENIMVDAQGRVRLIDLGMCVRVPSAPPGKKGVQQVQVKLTPQPRRGKAMYVCPEMALELESDPFAGDVWSLGVVLYVLLTHRPLYADPGDAAFACLLEDRGAELLAHYAALGIEGLTPLSSDLIVRMLRPRSEDRLTLEEVLAHPWITQAMQSPAPPTTTTAAVPKAKAVAASPPPPPPPPALATAATDEPLPWARQQQEEGGEEEGGPGGARLWARARRQQPPQQPPAAKEEDEEEQRLTPSTPQFHPVGLASSSSSSSSLASLSLTAAGAAAAPSCCPAAASLDCDWKVQQQRQQEEEEEGEAVDGRLKALAARVQGERRAEVAAEPI